MSPRTPNEFGLLLLLLLLGVRNRFHHRLRYIKLYSCINGVLSNLHSTNLTLLLCGGARNLDCDGSDYLLLKFC